jgi:menaquinone-9 beta-reductase
MTEWDIAVIGGGVAGSTAAALLAQHGLRVILLERGALPRQKVCGEFLSPEGVDVLRRLRAWSRLEAHHPPRIHSFTLTAGNRETRHPLPLPGWGVSRWVLDHALWEHATCLGVTARERCPVVQAAGDFQRGFSLTLQQPDLTPAYIQARAVLCAAGRHWHPRGQRTEPHASRHARFIGIKAHFQGVPLDGHVELHTMRHGYCGLVEVTGGVTNLCCWVEAKVLHRAGGAPPNVLTSALVENSRLRSRLREAQQLGTQWTTTSFAHGRTGLAVPVAEQMWNAGDCAAMVAPFTGDGMGMGLRAAELAATMLLAVFRHELSWDEAMAEYARRWRREFLPRLRWGRWLEAVLLQPWLATLSCWILDRAPSLMDQLYRRTRQLIPVAGPPMEVS